MKGFTGLGIDFDIQDGEWAKYLKNPPDVYHGRIDRVGILRNGTTSGKPIFALIGILDDGSTIVLETTWALMHNAAHALEVRYPAEE